MSLVHHRDISLSDHSRWTSGGSHLGVKEEKEKVCGGVIEKKKRMKGKKSRGRIGEEGEEKEEWRKGRGWNNVRCVVLFCFCFVLFCFVLFCFVLFCVVLCFIFCVCRER
jgi:Flp pilus assembly protein TadB